MSSAVSHTTPWATRALHSLVALTLAFLALAASSPAWADPPGRVGRIAEIDGNVWLFDDEQGEWVQARRNHPVTEGDRISAEQGGRAEVQIGAATLRLDGGTEVEFTQLDDARVRARLHGGSVALRVRSSESAREFAVVTNEGRYEPLRPGHYRIDVREQSSLGETLAGAMRFEARDSVLDLNDGRRAEFWQERGVTNYAWAAQSSDRFGDWVARQDREDTRDRNRYVSNEMTGAEDLDRHGRWDTHPDYGNVWYPTVVEAGWAPYRYGQWVHSRRYGWTWVDDAPWGFAPFHYGRWVHWGGRWAWAPGQYVARPVYAPALVAWFGGPHVSVGINIGGPAVGWVPLSPREIYYPHYTVSNVYVRNVNRTHGRWHGPNPRYERTVPTGPIMYTNQGVAGGVTVVPQNVMQSRQPIGNRVVVPVDNRTVAGWQGARSRNEPGGANAAFVPPAPPAARVVAAPGGAVPAAPGAVRPAPWGGAAARAGGATPGDDGQQSRRGGERLPPSNARDSNARDSNVRDGGGNAGLTGRGVVAPPSAVPSPNVPRPLPPSAAPQGQPQIVQQPTLPAQRESVPVRQREPRDQRAERDDRDNRGGERRIVAPVTVPRAVQPQAPAVQPPPQVQRPLSPPQVQRPVAPPPVVTQAPPRPQQPQGNPGQVQERERERMQDRAQDRNDDRRGEGPRGMRDQQVR